MEDEFNEFWMYRNQKNTKRIYKFFHPVSDVVKAPASNITKFLITLGGRIQERKNSSIDVEDVFGFPSISESMAGSNKSMRELIRKGLEEVEGEVEDEGEGESEEDEEARRSSIQSSTFSDESDDSECAREGSPGEIQLRYYNIPLSKEYYEEEYRRDSETSSIYIEDSDLAMYRKDSGFSSIRRDSGSPSMGRRDSPYPRDSDDSDFAMVKSPPPRRRRSSSSPRDSESPSPPLPTSPTRSSSSSLQRRDSQRTSWESRRSSLLKDMPWLDVFGPIAMDAVDTEKPASPIRFLDSNHHAVYRPIKQRKLVKNKMVEEDTVFLKEHKFQTKIEMLKHDRYDHIFYGTMDSDEDDESCGSDRVPFEEEEEPRPPSESSDDDHQTANRDYYDKYKPIRLGKSAFVEEKLFDRLLEEKKEENRKLLYGEKEKPPYCKYDPRNLIGKEKEKLRDRVHKDRQVIPLARRQMHDKEYKYVPEITCAGGSDRGRVDEEELFRLMELKFGKTKDDGRGRKKGREPKAMKRMIKKLKRVFRQECGKRKLKPRKISKKRAKEIQDKDKIKNLTNKYSEQLYKRIFNKKFDQLLAETAQKRAVGLLQSPRRSTVGSIKFDLEPKTEPETKPPLKSRRLITTRDFTEVPPKIIKALDTNGILFEENLYDKINHPLYKTVKVVKKPPAPKPAPVPVVKPPKKRRTKAKGKTQAKTKGGTPAAPARKPAGVRQHKDSLKKKKGAKKTPKKSTKSVSHAVVKEEKEIELKGEKPEPEIRVRTTIIESESLIDISEDDRSDSDKLQVSPRPSPPRKQTLKTSPDRLSPDSVKRSPEKRVSINPDAYSPSDDKVHVKDRMRSIFSYSGPPRSSKVDKSLIQEIRSRHSLKRKSSSRTPRRRRITIEFDPEAIGTITDSMKRFADFYNVPVSQLTKLAEGKIVIEPEERKSRSQRKRRSSPLKNKTGDEEETTNKVRTPSPNFEGEPSKVSPRRTIS